MRKGIDYGNDSLFGATFHYNYIPIAPDLILPASLTSIEAEAFTGVAFRYVKLSENTVLIGKNAFANCLNLRYIYIPAATTQIALDAFGDKTVLTILGKTGSAAETYAREHGFIFIVS